MQMLFCPSCKRTTGFKRAYGFGTIIMVFATLGLWALVALPFYPVRCTVCGMPRRKALPFGGPSEERSFENIHSSVVAPTSSPAAISTVATARCVICNAQLLPEGKFCEQCGADLTVNRTVPLGMKACPKCAEHIQLAAKKCRFCGELFD
jgi:hypothetical protein